MIIPADHVAALITQEMVATGKDEDDLYHRVEVGARHAVGKNETPENLCRIACSVDVDIASLCSIRNGHCGDDCMPGDMDLWV